MDYVTSDGDPQSGKKSPFSELPKMGDDRKALIVHRGKYHYIVLNRYPYNPGHLLILPFREVAELEELDAEERAEMMDLLILSQKILRTALNPDGFNIGLNLGQAGGAGIPKHLHFHVVPRWNGDSNFLPVIGKTRSLPQALDTTWECLHTLFAND
jgi:ATP adenylyltransferase